MSSDGQHGCDGFGIDRVRCFERGDEGLHGAFLGCAENLPLQLNFLISGDMKITKSVTAEGGAICVCQDLRCRDFDVECRICERSKFTKSVSAVLSICHR